MTTHTTYRRDVAALAALTAIDPATVTFLKLPKPFRLTVAGWVKYPALWHDRPAREVADALPRAAMARRMWLSSAVGPDAAETRVAAAAEDLIRRVPMDRRIQLVTDARCFG